MWHDILVGLSLVFVIEGVWPFLSPEGLRRAMLIVSEMDDEALRRAGFASMVAGVVLLYLIN